MSILVDFRSVASILNHPEKHSIQAAEKTYKARGEKPIRVAIDTAHLAIRSFGLRHKEIILETLPNKFKKPFQQTFCRLAFMKENCFDKTPFEELPQLTDYFFKRTDQKLVDELVERDLQIIASTFPVPWIDRTTCAQNKVPKKYEWPDQKYATQLQTILNANQLNFHTVLDISPSACDQLIPKLAVFSTRAACLYVPGIPEPFTWFEAITKWKEQGFDRHNAGEDFLESHPLFSFIKENIPEREDFPVLEKYPKSCSFGEFIALHTLDALKKQNLGYTLTEGMEARLYAAFVSNPNARIQTSYVIHSPERFFQYALNKDDPGYPHVSVLRTIATLRYLHIEEDSARIINDNLCEHITTPSIHIHRTIRSIEEQLGIDLPYKTRQSLARTFQSPNGVEIRRSIEHTLASKENFDSLSIPQSDQAFPLITAIRAFSRCFVCVRQEDRTPLFLETLFERCQKHFDDIEQSNTILRNLSLIVSKNSNSEDELSANLNGIVVEWVLDRGRNFDVIEGFDIPEGKEGHVDLDYANFDPNTFTDSILKFREFFKNEHIFSEFAFPLMMSFCSVPEFEKVFKLLQKAYQNDLMTANSAHQYIDLATELSSPFQLAFIEDEDAIEDLDHRLEAYEQLIDRILDCTKDIILSKSKEFFALVLKLGKHLQIELPDDCDATGNPLESLSALQDRLDLFQSSFHLENNEEVIGKTLFNALEQFLELDSEQLIIVNKGMELLREHSLTSQARLMFFLELLKANASQKELAVDEHTNKVIEEMSNILTTLNIQPGDNDLDGTILVKVARSKIKKTSKGSSLFQVTFSQFIYTQLSRYKEHISPTEFLYLFETGLNTVIQKAQDDLVVLLHIAVGSDEEGFAPDFSITNFNTAIARHEEAYIHHNSSNLDPKTSPSSIRYAQLLMGRIKASPPLDHAEKLELYGLSFEQNEEVWESLLEMLSSLSSFLGYPPSKEIVIQLFRNPLKPAVSQQINDSCKKITAMRAGLHQSHKKKFSLTNQNAFREEVASNILTQLVSSSPGDNSPDRRRSGPFENAVAQLGNELFFAFLGPTIQPREKDLAGVPFFQEFFPQKFEEGHLVPAVMSRSLVSLGRNPENLSHIHLSGSFSLEKSYYIFHGLIINTANHRGSEFEVPLKIHHKDLRNKPEIWSLIGDLYLALCSDFIDYSDLVKSSKKAAKVWEPFKVTYFSAPTSNSSDTEHAEMLICEHIQSFVLEYLLNHEDPTLDEFLFQLSESIPTQFSERNTYEIIQKTYKDLLSKNPDFKSLLRKLNPIIRYYSEKTDLTYEDFLDISDKASKIWNDYRQKHLSKDQNAPYFQKTLEERIGNHLVKQIFEFLKALKYNTRESVYHLNVQPKPEKDDSWKLSIEASQGNIYTSEENEMFIVHPLNLDGNADFYRINENVENPKVLLEQIHTKVPSTSKLVLRFESKKHNPKTNRAEIPITYTCSNEQITYQEMQKEIVPDEHGKNNIVEELVEITEDYQVLTLEAKNQEITEITEITLKYPTGTLTELDLERQLLLLKSRVYADDLKLKLPDHYS